MTNGLPTFSSLDRAKACPASCALPQTKSVSKFADRGTAIHAFLLSAKRGDANLPDVPDEYKDFCQSIDLDEIPTGRYEVTFGIETSTGICRLIGENLGREYPKDLRTSEMVGTADIFDIVTAPGDRPAVYIGDIKTGFGNHLPNVRDSLQLGAGAVAAARLNRVETAVIEFVKVMNNGKVSKERTVLDKWALDSIELEIVEIYRNVRKSQEIIAAGGKNSVTMGPHCTYCPAYTSCPAQVGLAMVLSGDHAALEKEIMTALTPAKAKVAYEKYKSAQDLLNRIRNAIYGYAQENPVDLGNGKVLGPVRVATPTLDAPMVHRLLARDFNLEIANNAVTWKTSKSAIKRALKPVCKYGTLQLTEGKILEELLEDGGVSVKERTEIRSHREGQARVEDDDE